MNFFNWNWFRPGSSSFYKKHWDGFLPWNIWSVAPVFNNYGDDLEKLNVVFSNPALLKVFCLQCDLFSLGRVYVYKDGKDIGPDPAIDRLKNPNPFQSRSQYLWDYMFWNMIGTAYSYVDSDVAEKEGNKLYWLEHDKMEWPLEIQRAADKLVFSKSAENEIQNMIIKYRYSDGSVLEIPIRKLIILTDLTNGTGNWFKSKSRIDALYKVISNSEAALDSENINIRFSGKFMVSGTNNPDDVTKLPLSEIEKDSIEYKIERPDKQVNAVKSMIDIKRFVENAGNQKLNEKYLAAYFIIGNMYNIPRDVLEAYNSSTYENQEKARGSHVIYTLQPKADDFTEALNKRWGYDKLGKEIIISWDHLPFMQIFEKDRQQTNEIKARTFANLANRGVPLSEINEFLDTNFSKYEQQTSPKGN